MKKIKAELKVVDFNVSEGNENYLQFEATAGYIGKPTRATPHGGAKGYAVILGDGDNVNELVGSGVNCSYDYKKHNKAFKIGVIDSAAMEENAIKVKGHLWKTDFPDVCDTIESAKEALGCSVEVYCNEMEIDEDAKTQTLRDVHFTGMSVVYKNKAAFEGTNFMCSIADKEDVRLNEKEVQDAVDKAVEAKMEEWKEKLKVEFAKLIEESKAEKSVESEQESKDEQVKVSFAEFADSVVRQAIKEELAALKQTVNPSSTETPKRKTQLFASEPQFQAEKTLVDLSKEIDNDPTLSPEQKWNAQMRLWLERDRQSA